MRSPRTFVAALALVAACQPMEDMEDRERAATEAPLECATGALLFARAYGGAGARSTVAVHSIVTGPSGDIWISGHHTGAVDFGAGIIESPDMRSFVTRFDPDGNACWTVHVPWEGAPRAKGIAVDADGNAFVGSVLSLTKLSPSGEELWSKALTEQPRGALFE
jgi:hypothetical protein